MPSITGSVPFALFKISLIVTLFVTNMWCPFPQWKQERIGTLREFRAGEESGRFGSKQSFGWFEEETCATCDFDQKVM